MGISNAIYSGQLTIACEHCPLHSAAVISDLNRHVMTVNSSFNLNVPNSLMVNSCNLQLGKSVGQGIVVSRSYIQYLLLPFHPGEFGIVYKAKLRKGFNEDYSETVAVKTLKG